MQPLPKQSKRGRPALIPQIERKGGRPIVERVLADMHLGRSLKEIAAGLGIHPRTLSRHLHKAGYEVRSKQIIDQKLIRTHRPRPGRSGVDGRRTAPQRTAALSPRPDRRR